MPQSFEQITVATKGAGLTDITRQVARFVAASNAALNPASNPALNPTSNPALNPASNIEAGLLTVFCRHTSASLLIQENADPDVRADLESFFQRLVRQDPALYRHGAEGPDDMPAHIRAALTQTSLCIPVQAGKLLLGTWQAIYLYEHRSTPHRREVALHLIG